MKYVPEKEFDVVAVSSGEEAFAMACRDTFRAIILDLLMDGMPGIEALRRLKEIIELQKALILTGFSGTDTAISAVNLGAFKYLLKPIGTMPMRKAIGEAFAKYEREFRAFNQIDVPEELKPLGLTLRGAEVALCVNRGEANAEIAKELRLSRRTVEKHVQSIFLN